jgi:hypothetical protein
MPEEHIPRTLSRAQSVVLLYNTMTASIGSNRNYTRYVNIMEIFTGNSSLDFLKRPLISKYVIKSLMEMPSEFHFT